MVVMKIDEFIKKVNRNDRMEAEEVDGVITIYNDSDHEVIDIPNGATNLLEINFIESYSRYNFGKPSREYLSALIEEFLHTPVKDRFPEKKYYLCVFPKKEALEWREESEAIWVNHIGSFDDGFRIDYGPKTAFTEGTLNTIKESLPFIAPAIDAMKEPVEDD